MVDNNAGLLHDDGDAYAACDAYAAYVAYVFPW